MPQKFKYQSMLDHPEVDFDGTQQRVVSPLSGELTPLAELCRLFKISQATVSNRMRRGKTLKEALKYDRIKIRISAPEPEPELKDETDVYMLRLIGKRDKLDNASPVLDFVQKYLNEFGMGAQLKKVDF